MFWSDGPFFPIDTAYFVRSEFSLYYLSFLLRSMNFINNDAAVPGLNRQQAYANKLLFPFEALITQFEAVIKPCFETKRVLGAQIQQLTLGVRMVEHRQINIVAALACEFDCAQPHINAGDQRGLEARAGKDRR